MNTSSGHTFYYPELLDFAIAMDKKAHRSDVEKRKGSAWRGESLEWLFARLVEEVGELAGALASGHGDPEDECCDVGAIAMMVRSAIARDRGNQEEQHGDLPFECTP